MKSIINKAFYTGTHPASYRSGESAEIIGVKMVQPTKDHEVRPCYHIRFEDGFEDYAPMHDFGLYTITLENNEVDGTLIIYVDTEDGIPGSELGYNGRQESPCKFMADAEKLRDKLISINPESEVVIKEV